MALLVLTSEEDSWLAVASFIGELIDAGQVSPLSLEMVTNYILHSGLSLACAFLQHLTHHIFFNVPTG
jgi:hypothetical protein